MTCDIEWSKLGLTDDQRGFVDSELNKFLEANKKVETAVKNRNAYRERLDKLRLDKKEEIAIFRGEKEAIRKAVTERKERIKTEIEKEKEELISKRSNITKEKGQLEAENREVLSSIRAKQGNIENLLQTKGVNSTKISQLKKQLKELKDNYRDKKDIFNEKLEGIKQRASTEIEDIKTKYEDSINGLKQEIEDITNASKAEREAEKQLRAARSEVTNRITRAFMRDNRKSINRTLFEEAVTSGKISLKNFLDQFSFSQHNLFSKSEHYINNLVEGLDSDIFDKANPSDPNDAMAKEFLKQMRSRHNAQVTGHGMFDTHGFRSPNEHPVHIAKERIMKLLFKSFRLAKDNNGLNQLKADIEKYIGREKFMEHIERVYKGEDIPTFEQALDEYHTAHAEGNDVKLFTSPVEFKDYESAVEFTNRYSNGNIVHTYAMNARITGRAMAKFDVGGKISDRFIKANAANDKEANRLMAYRDHFWHEYTNMSVAQYRISQSLSNVTGLEVAARATTLAASPMADSARGAAIMAARYGDNNNLVNATASILQSLGEGVLHPAKFLKVVADRATGSLRKDEMGEFTRVFGIVNNHMQERSASSLLPIGGKLSPSRHLGHHLEWVDQALALEQSKRMASILKKNFGKSLDELPDSLGKDLKETFNINKKDWENIQEVLKDKDTLLSTDFKGDLAKKVASMAYRDTLDATPNQVIIPSRAMMMLKRQYPNMYRFISMFWSFAARGIYGSYRAGMNINGASSVVNVFAHQAAGGWFGNFVYGYLAQGVSMDKWDPQEYINDPDNYTEAFLGAMGHLASTGSSVVFNPSTFLYGFNPNVGLAIKLGQLTKYMCHSLYSYPEWDKVNKASVNAAMSITPIVGQWHSAKEWMYNAVNNNPY